MATHIKDKLTESAGQELRKYRCGFRQGRGKVDQIFDSREIQAENQACGK